MNEKYIQSRIDYEKELKEKAKKRNKKRSLKDKILKKNKINYIDIAQEEAIEENKKFDKIKTINKETKNVPEKNVPEEYKEVMETFKLFPDENNLLYRIGMDDDENIIVEVGKKIGKHFTQVLNGPNKKMLVGDIPGQESCWINNKQEAISLLKKVIDEYGKKK